MTEQLKSVELEQSVLGACMANNALIDDVAAVIQPEHFAEEVHAKIFERLILEAQKGCADALKLRPFFENEELLANAGYGQYLEDLQAASIGGAVAIGHARSILDFYKRRNLIAQFQDKATRLMDPTEPFEGIVGELDQAMTNLDTAGRMSPVSSLEEVQASSLKLIDSALKNGQFGQLTRFTALNQLTRAWMPGHFIIIGARPAMGKTAFTTELGLDFAKSGKKTLFASLEMSEEDLLERIAAKDLGFSFLDVDSYVNDTGKQKDVQRWLNSPPLRNFWISDLSAPTVSQIRAMAKRHKKAHGLDFLIIDYLQLMGTPQKGMTEFAATEANSKALKSLAKELKITIVCLSQLSRALESRDDKRPRMQDLRNSGSIEQDADKIIFLYRSVYYLRQELEKVRDDVRQEKPGSVKLSNELELRIERESDTLDLIVAKNRRGSVGSAKVGWNQKKMRFWNMEQRNA